MAQKEPVGLIKRLFVVAFLLLAIAGTHAHAAATRVLFIGNSYTYYNEMPWMLEQIARSKGIDLRCDMSIEGGATLKRLWDGGRAPEAIHQAHFDYVFIQPQSSEILRTPDETRMYAKTFANAIRDSGAQPILFAPWPPGQFASMQMQFRNSYRNVSSSLHIRLAPVDTAWQNAKTAGMRLYSADGSHPNLAGSYVAACVFFAMIFDRDPAGATYVFKPSFDTTPEHRQALGREQITASTAAALQRAAWDAVKNEPLAKR